MVSKPRECRLRVLQHVQRRINTVEDSKLFKFFDSEIHRLKRG